MAEANQLGFRSPAPYISRRGFVVGGVAAAGLMIHGPALAGPPRLFVFVPTDEKPRSVEKALQSSMPGLVTTVFGKAADFESELAAQKPEAALALAPGLQALGLSPVLRGARSGATEEEFVLLTVDAPIAPKALGSETVGVFGFMGRQETKKFCGKLMGTGDQKVKTVTKYADLLPMLQFNAAKGVLLPRRFTKALMGSSKLKLVINELPSAKVGLPAVAVMSPSVAGAVQSAIRGMNGEAKGYLGVDAWT